MDYPYGHNHHRRDEDEYPPPQNVRPPYDPHYNDAPPPPHVRPGFDPYYNQPPPPHVTNVHHTSHTGGGPYSAYPPPANTDYYNPPPPNRPPNHEFHHSSETSVYPPPSHEFHHSSETPVYPPPPHRNDPYSSGSNVHHVSHESYENNPHHSSPHMPNSIPGRGHNDQQASDYLRQKPSVRVYSKAETNYSLTIRDGKVILARSDPSDPFQHWVKDEKYSTKVKDEQGFPSFALVNKATGQAIKHSIGATHPVQLIPYVPDKFDESILWTFSTDLGDGYRTIRMVNNIRLNVDAFNGDKNHGGVHDGTTIVLWEWAKGENQRWKIIPY